MTFRRDSRTFAFPPAVGWGVTGPHTPLLLHRGLWVESGAARHSARLRRRDAGHSTSSATAKETGRSSQPMESARDSGLDASPSHSAAAT